jgi:diguanylate cyclase (GGDEF)-like protein
MQQLRSTVVRARKDYDDYLLNSSLLPAYRHSLEAVGAEIKELKQITADNATQQKRLNSLAEMMRFDPRSPKQLLFTDSERRSLLAISDEETALLGQRQEAAEVQSRFLSGMTLLCSLGIFVATAQSWRISSLKTKALRTLADRTTQLETVLSRIPAAVLIRNRAGVCLEILSEGNSLLFDPQRMVGTTPFDVAPIKVATQLMNGIERALDTQQTVEAGYEFRLSSGRLVWFDTSINPLPGDRVLIMAADATQEHRMTRQLIRLATQDGLTNLYNHNTFVKLVQSEIALRSRPRQSTQSFALCLFDLDYFKAINTTYTHSGGDLALQAVARSLQENVRGEAHVARLGGDELAVLLREIDASAATKVAERLKDAIAKLCIPSPKGEIRVTVSVGIALYSNTCNTFEALHQSASEALLEGKAAGRDRVCVAE